MSTPSTATATLPPYHHLRYHLGHQPLASQSSLSSCQTKPLLNSTPRLGYPASSNCSTTSSIHSTSTSSPNGLSLVTATPASTVTRSYPYELPSCGALRADPVRKTTTAAMPAHGRSAGDTPSNRKRRRSKEPDWNVFYKNGLPKEIIVIDDSPGPVDASSAIPTASYPSGSSCCVAAGSLGRHSPAPKRQKKSTHYDPVRSDNYAVSHTTPSRINGSKSTVSSDGSSSALHTTAATSLGSASSNSHYDYDDVQPGQKRKRATRQQAADARRRENPDAFLSYRPPPNPPIKAPEVLVKVIQDTDYNRNVKVDDEDGHYIVAPEADLTTRYQMKKLLGQGTFGKVVQARDKKRNKLVAIKIIRSVQKYRDASKIELRVLATLKQNDVENRNRCIHLRDCFDYRGHICIVMDLLGQSVFDFLKSNNFVPFPNSQIQNFARQLLTSVAFLHDLRLIHTDLKPENILLCDNTYQTFTYNRTIPSSTKTSNRRSSQRKVLLDTEIRLIDFGSATFQDEYHSSVVSTRHYRAPEIILGLGWSYPCDIWSIGCILVEFYTGDALFQTHDNLEHLAMMEAVVGQRIDPPLVQQVNKMHNRGNGNPAAKYFKRLKLDYPSTETTPGSRRYVKAMKRLEDIIPRTSRFFDLFLNLLKKIFVYDPSRRITAKEALQHPWFKEVPYPDDGTEAAKIRLDKERERLESSRLPAIHS